MMRASRRDFVKLLTVSGISVAVSRLSLAQIPDFATRETLPGRRGLYPAGPVIGRVDGAAKVTGAKLYASDFRAADMPGWPSETSHALLVRVDDATHVFEGIDLSFLSAAAKPSVVVTAEDLVRAGTRSAEFYAGDPLCPAGSTPVYLGQPTALLIFERFDTYDRARLELRARCLVPGFNGALFSPAW